MRDSINIDPITKHTRFSLRDDARAKPVAWRWPLPRLGNRTPMILGEYTGDHRHGVELGYAVAPFDSELFVPVYAVQSGQLSFALESADGFSVSIDHGGTTTHYARLSKMFVPRTLPRLRRRHLVRAGEVIGYAAKTPRGNRCTGVSDHSRCTRSKTRRTSRRRDCHTYADASGGRCASQHAA